MEAKRVPKTLTQLASEKAASAKVPTDGEAPAPSSRNSTCMKVTDETCFGFELELADNTVHAFPYHTFAKILLSPIGSVLELQLSSCKVTFRGERLRHVVSAMRRGYDVALRPVDPKYSQSIPDDEPVITEIKIEFQGEAEESVGKPGDPAPDDEPIEPAEQP